MKIPDGFEPHYKKSMFTDPWEPLFSKIEDDQVRIGVVLRDVHCNSRGFVHGGFLAAIADNSLGLSCGRVLQQNGQAVAGLVTTNLAIDYVGRAKLGEWIQTSIEVVKTGKTLCVANCLITGSESIVARANATFQIV